MSILHRAGLGGLACALHYIERAYRDGVLLDKDVPGGPWPGGQPPWKIEPLQITLDFGGPRKAREFLKRLFALAFDRRDDLIFLPAQYPRTAPDMAVRAEVQLGLVLTFLQHGKVRKLAKAETTFTNDIGGKPVTVSYKKCSGYKHQEGWKELSSEDGCLSDGPLEVSGPLNPGAVVRHVAFTGDTRIEEQPGHVLALHFSLIGCLALPINRGTGALIVPEVTDLLDFSRLRPHMTPQQHRDCQVGSASDAALQAQVRLLAARTVTFHDLPGCFAATFRPTPWASQQKSRVQALYVPRRDEKTLRQFETALAVLPPRLVSGKTAKPGARGKGEQAPEKAEWFWADSIVRPLVADNLAQGRRWYEGFVKLMREVNPASRRPFRDDLFFEKEGLQAMTEKTEWQDRGESTLVKAVQEALGRRYAQIADETKKIPAARKNRWKGEYERWRLAFVGAKTPDQFRGALCDLLSRGGMNKALQEEWPELLPMLHQSRWSLARDLALLALASYKGKGAQDVQPDAGETASATESDQ
jgi:CRISPR-associated protein Cas8a1/Csx13